VCIDIAYNVFEHEVFVGVAADQVSGRTRRIARRRSLVVLAIFTAAMLTAFVVPRVGFGLVCGALILRLLPDSLAVAGVETKSRYQDAVKVTQLCVDIRRIRNCARDFCSQ